MPFDALARVDDLATLSDDALVAEVTGLAAHIHAAEVARRNLWAAR